VNGSRAKAAVASIALGALLAGTIVPAWRVTAGKRRLREGETLLLLAARQTDAAARAAVLRDAEEVLDDAAQKLPYDSRPPYLLGSGALLRGDFPAALERYRRSLAIEERPETDLNLARAHAAAGEAEAAAADALRAVWLAPSLLRDLPPDARPAVEAEVIRREKQLSLGNAAIPPLAEEPVR
jgi:tetratricopeptide (TPR) repeat protein